jgi:MFS family permease
MLYRARKYKCIHQEPIELSNTAKTNIPEGLGGSKAWLIWSLAALAFGYAFFHRVAPSVMVSELMGEFAIGGAMLGTLSALYFYPYVLLQLPLGGLLDLTGTRILLSSAIALASLGSILFGMATTIEIAYLGRVLIGIGSSVGFLGSLALASR